VRQNIFCSYVENLFTVKMQKDYSIWLMSDTKSKSILPLFYGPWCWNRTGSPPPLGSKNEVLMFRSVNSIVIAPARTGSDSDKAIEFWHMGDVGEVDIMPMIPSNSRIS